MSLFEELCKDAGIPSGTYAEQAMAEIVNDMIFDDADWSDEEIKAEALKRFNELDK